jgi:hypothetical protein
VIAPLIVVLPFPPTLSVWAPMASVHRAGAGPRHGEVGRNIDIHFSR